MIDLTVKTLDSQNHAFSLADDITIREFKEHIADTVSVPADSQRLIYCGRVLQDEKRLSEYDVNGKVIHLVQRAPPQSTQRGNSGGGQSQGENAGRNDQAPHRGVRFHQTRTQIHGNPMYLGSISIPAEVVEDHERMISRVSTALARSRLNDASRMLDHVNRLLDRLENSNAAPTDDNPTFDTHVSDNDEPSLANDETEQSPGVSMEEQTTAERVLGETSSQDAADDLPETGAAAAQPARASDSLPTRSDNNETSTQEESPSASRSGNRRSRRGCRVGRSRPSNRPVLRGPPLMAQLLGRLIDTQDRLRPFLTRYRDFMELDPKVPGGRTATGEDIGTVEENQRLLDVVSECLHTLSHANHAMSEIVIDVAQQPQRDLRRYPIMSQRSAIIQAGIPIQVEAHISVARNDRGNGENGEETGDTANRPPTSATGAQSTAQTPVDLSFVVEQQSDATPSTPQQTSEQQQQAPNQSQFELPFGAILNLTNNIEVGLMEMGSPDGGGITVSGMSAPGAEQTNGSNSSNNNNNDNAAGTSRVAGIFPWRPAPPPVVIRNLMDVVAGYMAQGAANVAVATTATTISAPNTCQQQRGMAAGVGGGAAPNPGQSTQARSNVGTHPTTSTRTRSTARPHVFHPHAHPLGVGGGVELNTSFDQFLVCDSHHIHRTRRAAPNYSAATSSSQQTSQPSQNTTPNGNAQPQSEGPSTSAGDTSSSAVGETEPKIRLIDEIEMSHPANGGPTRNPSTLEKLLLDRGINITCPESSTGSSLWQRLLTAFARIEITEWFAFLETGKFSRDTWRKLRPHLTSLMVFNGLECQEKEFIDGIVSEAEAYLRTIFSADEPSTVDADRINFITKNLLFTIRHCAREVAGFIKGNVGVSNDQKWGMGLAYIMQECGSEMCTVLLRNLEGDVERLEQLIRFFATRAMSSHHSELQEWIHGCVVHWLCEYTRVQESNSMTQMLRMFTAPTITVDTSEDITGWNDITDAPRPQETPSQPAPEPMETEEASGNRTINDPLEIDDGQEVPTTFPGHEQLLPEWVPIIARDGIRQRRQLQLQSTGVTAFSDAYLDGLPSKRRKLVDQQKPRLLVSPTPNNSAIAASMERLVRDSAVRAGVEEADGAAAAVAADPGVRRAFGQAIRECFNPRRFQPPDFPDARRFPNATSYFTDKDRSPKQ